MSIRHTQFTVTTDGSGNATVYSPVPVDGLLQAIRVIRGTLASGLADITITDDASGMALLTLTNITADADYFPRPTASTIAGGGALANSWVEAPLTGKVKVVVAQGGAAASGTIHLWWKD